MQFAYKLPPAQQDLSPSSPASWVDTPPRIDAVTLKDLPALPRPRFRSEFPSFSSRAGDPLSAPEFKFTFEDLFDGSGDARFLSGSPVAGAKAQEASARGKERRNGVISSRTAPRLPMPTRAPALSIDVYDPVFHTSFKLPETVYSSRSSKFLQTPPPSATIQPPIYLPSSPAAWRGGSATPRSEPVTPGPDTQPLRLALEYLIETYLSVDSRHHLYRFVPQHMIDGAIQEGTSRLSRALPLGDGVVLIRLVPSTLHDVSLHLPGPEDPPLRPSRQGPHSPLRPASPIQPLLHHLAPSAGDCNHRDARGVARHGPAPLPAEPGVRPPAGPPSVVRLRGTSSTAPVHHLPLHRAGRGFLPHWTFAGLCPACVAAPTREAGRRVSEWWGMEGNGEGSDRDERRDGGRGGSHGAGVAPRTSEADDYCMGAGDAGGPDTRDARARCPVALKYPVCEIERGRDELAKCSLSFSAFSLCLAASTAPVPRELTSLTRSPVDNSLLASIQAGRRLKAAKTVDKSAPAVAGEPRCCCLRAELTPAQVGPWMSQSRRRTAAGARWGGRRRCPEAAGAEEAEGLHRRNSLACSRGGCLRSRRRAEA